MRQEIVRWTWHQQDHIQIICTSLQCTDRYHTSNQFLQDRYSSWFQTNCSNWRLTENNRDSITHTNMFNGLCPGLRRWASTRKVKTNLDFIGARDSEWQWHQLGHMQICTSLQANNHASTPPTTQVFYRPDALPAAQPTASKHWRHTETA